MWKEKGKQIGTILILSIAIFYKLAFISLNGYFIKRLQFLHFSQTWPLK